MEDQWEEPIYLSQLFGFYGAMLTETQQRMFLARYRYDLSLKEIAEQENITRTAVYDAIKKAAEGLKSMEASLQMFTRYQRLLAIIIKAEQEKKIEGELAEQLKGVFNDGI